MWMSLSVSVFLSFLLLDAMEWYVMYINHGIKRNKIDEMAFLTLFECVLSVSLTI